MRRWLPHLAMAAAIATLAALADCTSRDDDGPGPGRITELPQPGPELSQELMLGLALARNFHHKADVYLKEARVEEAVAAVRQILGIKFPAGSPEGEDVLADARARLAKLLVTRGELDEATVIVDQGIAASSRPSFFVANLHTVRGEVLEAQAARIEERDRPGAARVRRQAIEAFDRAIAIEKALMDSLGGGEP